MTAVRSISDYNSPTLSNSSFTIPEEIFNNLTSVKFEFSNMTELFAGDSTHYPWIYLTSDKTASAYCSNICRYAYKTSTGDGHERYVSNLFQPAINGTTSSSASTNIYYLVSPGAYLADVQNWNPEHFLKINLSKVDSGYVTGDFYLGVYNDSVNSKTCSFDLSLYYK